jgi:hypothetical protein
LAVAFHCVLPPLGEKAEFALAADE